MQDAQLEPQLVERAKSGERAAFDSLIEIYKGKAFALSFSITGNYEDARDILQEAFVKAYVNIRNFRGGAGFYTWFYRILVNLCRDFLRKRQAKRRFLTEWEDRDEGTLEVIDVKPDPSETILNKEIRQMLDKAIDLLPEKQKMAFILKHIQGMKIGEVAAVLNCKQSTAKVHLFRSEKALRKTLSPYISD